MTKKLFLLTVLIIAFQLAKAQPQKLANVESSTGQYFNLNGTVVFANDNLWKTDGTPASTMKLTSFNFQSDVRTLILSGDILYFTVSDNNGYTNQLWKSDGTIAGTTLVKEFTPANANSISRMCYLNGTTYVMVQDRLYKTDGTSGGTVQIKDLNPAYTTNSADALFHVKNTLFIVLSNSQLWKSDGTSSGTTLIQTFDYTNYLNSFGNYAMLEVVDAAHGREPWKVDEFGNVTLIKDINPGPSSSTFNGISDSGQELNGYYYFQVTDPTRVMKTDGTTAGTTVFLNSDYIDFRPLNNKLYIFDNNELLQTDGTSSPTLVRSFDGPLMNYCIIGDLMLISENGKKLWEYDTDNNTFKIIAEYPETYTDRIRIPDIGSLVTTGKDVYFTLITEELGEDYSNTKYELYKYSPFKSGITSLSLVNAVTDTDVRNLKSVDTVYTDEAINIRANGFGSFTSVKFYINDALYKTDNTSPYTLGNYTSGNYLEWPKQEGVYKIKITTVSDGNDLASTYYLHVLKRNITFTLINANTDLDIGSLVDGQVINLANIGTNKLNIRANSSMPNTNSIVFDFDGAVGFRTENSAPYSLFTDFNGNYSPWTAVIGSHTLKATPYKGNNASGTSGISNTVHFSIINQSARYSSIETFPNPIENNITLKIEDIEDVALITITDLSGREYYSGKQLINEGIIETDLSGLSMKTGIYILKVVTESGTRTSKIFKK